MANYIATVDMTLEQAIANGSMVSGENLTIKSGAIITCDQTPSILIGRVYINEGKLLVDGINISTGNMINFVGESFDEIQSNGQGTFEVKGDWFDIGTTDGTNSQVIDLSSATGTDYWDGDFCVDVIPMIQIETGRRVDFDNSSGGTPEVDDWVRKTSNTSVIGRIVEVQSTYLVVRYLTGSLVDGDAIQIRKIVDSDGPDLQVVWTANVNNASGDIKEDGVYQEFGNVVADGVSHIADFHHGVGGFVFSNIWQSTDITLGSSAGSVGGFVPPSGCNIRVPNVHFSSSNTTSYASNNTYHDGSTIEGNRYNLNTSSAGKVEFSVCNIGSAWFGCSSANSISAEYVGATIDMGSIACPNKVTYRNCVITRDPLGNAIGLVTGFRVHDCSEGVEIIDCMMVNAVSYAGLGAETSIDVIVTGCVVSTPGVTILATSGVICYSFSGCKTVTFDNNIAINGDGTQNDYCLFLTSTRNFTASNFIISCTQDETPQTTSTTAIYAISFSNDFYLSGLEILGNGTPGGYLVYLRDMTSAKVRGIGMIDDKVDFSGVGGSMAYVYGICTDIDISRCWVTNGAYEEAVLIGGVAKNVVVSNCSGDYYSEFQPAGTDNILFQGVHAGAGNPGLSGTGIEDGYLAQYGRQIHDAFRSDTVGYVVCLMITPSSSLNNTAVIAGDPKFFNDGDLNMVSGDVIEFEQDYYMKGHTGLSGGFTACTGGSSWNADEWSNVTLDFQYQLEGGSWNGTWLDVRTASNLTGISGAIEEGIRFKIRFTATGTQSDMTMLILDTTTTINDQKANFYPIDQNERALAFIGLADNTEVRVYKVSDDSELMGVENSSGGSFSDTFIHPGTDIEVYYHIINIDYKWIRNASFTLTDADITIPIQQIPDTTYKNP